ncbi:hypothetical protein ACFLYD_01675 [Chloroflexota bacterium]
MRADFAKPTVDTLAKRVNYRCSNPNCRKLIDNDPERCPSALLHDWKDQAERAALDELEQRAPLLDRLASALTGDTEAQRALRNWQAMLKLVRNTWALAGAQGPSDCCLWAMARS